MSHLWHLYLSMPHPSLAELLISIQVFIVLYPIRLLLREVETITRKERQLIISQHIRFGHEGNAHFCMHKNCRKLAKDITVGSDI